MWYNPSIMGMNWDRAQVRARMRRQGIEPFDAYLDANGRALKIERRVRRKRVSRRELRAEADAAVAARPAVEVLPTRLLVTCQGCDRQKTVLIDLAVAGKLACAACGAKRPHVQMAPARGRSRT
jgi:hypothetical protein